MPTAKATTPKRKTRKPRTKKVVTEYDNEDIEMHHYDNPITPVSVRHIPIEPLLPETIAEDNYREIEDTELLQGVKGFESSIILPTSKREYVNQINYYATKAKATGKYEGFYIGMMCGIYAITIVLLPFILRLISERNGALRAVHHRDNEVASLESEIEYIKANTPKPASV